ncbi:MAG: hypothetical protein EBQ89_02095 [Alphaproteobacteria bacterium]|nr:hypothetical protein [Alphaproteobacteria bacterium]
MSGIRESYLKVKGYVTRPSDRSSLPATTVSQPITSVLPVSQIETINFRQDSREAGSCHHLDIHLADGTTRTFDFYFYKNDARGIDPNAVANAVADAFIHAKAGVRDGVVINVAAPDKPEQTGVTVENLPTPNRA